MNREEARCSVFSCSHNIRGKSTIEGENGYAKTRIIDFPREVVIFPGRAGFGVGKNSTINQFSCGKFYYGKVIVVFPGRGGLLAGGGVVKVLSDSLQ